MNFLEAILDVTVYSRAKKDREFPMHRLRRRFTFWTFILLFAFTSRANAETPTAAATIERFHAELLDVMKNAGTLGYVGRKAKMEKIVPAALDLEFMSEKSIGARWKTLNASEQTHLRAALRNLAICRYASRFNGYSGETFQLLGEETEPNGLALVRTQITKSNGEIIAMNYRLHQVDGRWLVIDVLLNGNVSELAMRRSEFSTVLKQEGVDGLITSIQKSVTEIETTPTRKTENKAS